MGNVDTEEMDWGSELRQILVSSIKGEKTPLQRLEFFLLRSPPNEAGSVLIFRARCSVAELGSPAVWVFSVSGFHRLFATKPVSSETSKAERCLKLIRLVRIEYILERCGVVCGC